MKPAQSSDFKKNKNKQTKNPAKQQKLRQTELKNYR